MAVIRWGIIGVGDVTEVKSGPAFQRAEGSELVAVMRRNGDLAKDYAMRHGVPKYYDDANQLIHDEAVDAVYIATPPAFHMPYTLAVANAKKPIYVEKPMACTYSECISMVEAAKEADVPLFVAYYRRRLPRFLKIKSLIDSGAIGEVSSVSTLYLRKARSYEKAEDKPWRVVPELAGGGLLYDLASHTLDFLDFLFGPIEQVQGQSANRAGYYGPEDVVTGSYRFQSGVIGSGTWCFTAPVERDINRIVGTKGEIQFATLDGDAPVLLYTEDGVERFDIAHPPHIQEPLIQSIVDSLLGRGSCPSTGETGARTSRVLDILAYGEPR